MDLKLLIQECEEALRAGRATTVAAKIAGVALAKVPAEWRLPLANLCRRSGLFPQALKVLMPAVYKYKSEWNPDATAGELAEYAVVLERSGATFEALEVLKRVPSGQLIDAHLYRAFCHFKSWDYALAIPELKAYLAVESRPYSRFIGHVNLAASLVAIFAYSEARQLLSKLIEDPANAEFSRLRGNCHELRAQTYLHQGRYEEADTDLKTALRIFSSEKTLDRFFVDKWLWISEAFQSSNPIPLQELRNHALRREDWESVREADLFLCKIKPNPTLLHHLHAGTPFPAYKSRIETLTQQKPLAKEYTLGSITTSALNLNDHHRALSALFEDLYRPKRIPEIHAFLYPGEHWNPYSSPGRVHQALFRMRSELKEQRINIGVARDGLNYSAVIGAECAVRLPAPKSGQTEWDRIWNQLAQQWPGSDALTSESIRSMSGMRKTRCKSFLNWAQATGKIQKLGANNFSSYVKAA